MPKINEDTGISLLKINTLKGKKLFEDIKDNIECYESNYKEAYRANHKFPMALSIRRFKIMNEIDDMAIDKLLKIYNQFKNKKSKNKKIKNNSI